MVLSFRSRSTLLSTVFLACVSFAIVMPSLWPYLQQLGADKRFLALVVSFYSVGEGIGAILFGSIAPHYRTRTVMVWATIVGAFGSALYATAALWPRAGVGAWMIFLGRFSQGLWTGGAQAAQQTHLSKTLPIDQLTSTTVTINAYACFGFVVGPAFGLLFEAIPSFCILGTPLCVTQLTSPGYFVLLSAIATVALFVYCFDDDDINADGVSSSAMTDSTDSNETHSLVKQGSCDLENGISSRSPFESFTRDEGNLTLAILVCNFCFFVHYCGFALQETITTPLVQAYYRWGVHSANLLFTAAGACSLLAFIVVGKLSNVVEDKTFVAISLVTGALGYALLSSRLSAHPGKPQFLMAFLLISIAFPLGRASVMSLYTKILPFRMQGSGQGAILAVGALARIIGPFAGVGIFMHEYGGVAVFGGTSVMFAISATLFRFAYTSLWSRLESEPNKGEHI